jgi:hypothetical protein
MPISSHLAMNYEFQDFNGADSIFGEIAADEWSDLEAILTALPFFLQPSDQAQRIGIPIFDPKATNAYLTVAAASFGWKAIPVPDELTMFGKDWDGGRASVLAEWQFSNYPFLWNNVIRSEAVFKSRVVLKGLQPVNSLVIVTKSGALPASNSTLYYEQACAQLTAVTNYDTFAIPIRVVGLTIPKSDRISATWTEYPSRYARQGGIAVNRTFLVTRMRANQYGVQGVRFALEDPN